MDLPFPGAPATFNTAFRDVVIPNFSNENREMYPGIMPTAGFPPDVWGPSAWKLIHLAAAAFPENPTNDVRARYAAFFGSLEYVLPCGGCRMGYRALLNGSLKLSPEVLADRLSLFRWTVELHNAVNVKLGKQVSTDWFAWYRYYDGLRAQ